MIKFKSNLTLLNKEIMANITVSLVQDVTLWVNVLLQKGQLHSETLQPDHKQQMYP